MNPRLFLSCSAALAFAVMGYAQNPDQRPGQPQRPDLRPPSPTMHRQHDGAPQAQRGHQSGRPGDPHARLRHLTEAIQHLRAAGLNESAENLDKMAREMREHLERQQQNAGGSPAGSQPGAIPPAAIARLEEMQKEIRSLANQMQELRKMIQGHHGDSQRSARPPEGPRDEDRRIGSDDRQPRRPDGPPQGERPRQDGDRHRAGVQDAPPREKPPGEPRKELAPDAKAREDRPRDSAPREGAPRDDGPRDSAQRDGASGASAFTDQDRARFMALSEPAREKLTQEMRASRDKMMNKTPEERMKVVKELFERIEAEDKAQRN